MYETYFLRKWLPRCNQILTQLRFHPQLSNKRHPVDGVLVGAGSLLPSRLGQPKLLGFMATLQAFGGGGLVGIRPP
jgi:hypothetical protein